MSKIDDYKLRIFCEKCAKITKELKRVDIKAYNEFVEYFKNFSMDDPDWDTFIDDKYFALFGTN